MKTERFGLIPQFRCPALVFGFGGLDFVYIHSLENFLVMPRTLVFFWYMAIGVWNLEFLHGWD